VYRPDCKTIPDPHTYKEAVRKYRKKEGSIDDRSMRGHPLTNRQQRYRLRGTTDNRTTIIASVGKPRHTGLNGSSRRQRVQDTTVNMSDNDALIHLAVEEAVNHDNNPQHHKAPITADGSKRESHLVGHFPKIQTPRERASAARLTGESLTM